MATPSAVARVGRAIVHEPNGNQYIGHVEVLGRVVHIKGHVRVESLGWSGLEYHLGVPVDKTLVNRRVEIDWLADEAGS